MKAKLKIMFAIDLMVSVTDGLYTSFGEGT